MGGILFVSDGKKRRYEHSANKGWDRVFRKLGLKHKEVCDLYDVFDAVDTDGSQQISAAEFLGWAEVDSGGPFVKKLFKSLDIDKSGELDFLEFTVAMWSYCTLMADGLNCFIFDMYDTDDSGLMEPQELTVILGDMLGRSAGNNATAEKRSGKHAEASVKKSMEVVTTYLGDKVSGALDQTGFLELVSSEYDLTAPAFELQERLRKKVVGLKFWRGAIGHRMNKMKDPAKVLLEVRELVRACAQGEKDAETARAAYVDSRLNSPNKKKKLAKALKDAKLGKAAGNSRRVSFSG